MAFKGDLQNISLFDIFQTLGTNSQTGVLVLQQEGVTKKVYFSPEGVRVLFARSFMGFRLGDVFVRRGLVTQQDIEFLLNEQRREYRPLGELLVASGKVTENDVISVLQYHAEDEIFDIFGWTTGTFAFYDGEEITEEDYSPLTDVVLDPASLCLEAARRLDEMEQVRELIPDSGVFYTQAEDAGRPDEKQNEEKICVIFDALEAPANAEEVRTWVGLSKFDVLRSLFLLRKGDLIRELTVDELLDCANESRKQKDWVRASALLDRAHLVAADDRGILEACIEVTRRLDDPQHLARLLAALGTLCVEAGDLDVGVDHLKLSLKREPSNFTALTALRNAYIGQGDADHTADVSLRLARVHADNGHLFQGVEAARVGLEAAPNAIALRYYLAQLLARTSRNDEAKSELYLLIDETESSARALRSGKVHELLASCYRLLLRIDPLDERAVEGRSLLGRRKIAVLRRRRWMVRGGIAAGVLCLVLGIAVAWRGPSADELLRRIENAAATNNRELLLQNLDELMREYPDSDQASAAMGVKDRVDGARKSVETRAKMARDKLRAALTSELDSIRGALTQKAPAEALNDVARFLSQLDKSQAAFLRKEMSTHLQYALGVFLERVLTDFERDQRTFVQSNVLLNSKGVKTVEELLMVEEALEEVRARHWNDTIPALVKDLEAIAKSKHIGKLGKKIEHFRTKSARGSVLGVLDDLYFMARARRMRLQVDRGYDAARADGEKALEMCEFKKARVVFDDLYRLTRSVDDEQPRKHFLDLLSHMERTGIQKFAEESMGKIDSIVSTIARVKRLREEGDEGTPEAFHLMRGLVNRHRLIRFEERYKLPFLIRSAPTGSNVMIGAQSVGVTPCTVDLPIYEKTEILVRREGFAESSVEIEPLDGERDGELRVDLDKSVTWSRRLSGEVQAEPVILEDLLLVASRNGRLLALKKKNGATKFVLDTGVLEGIQARPVTDGKTVFVITLDGVLHFVSLEKEKIDGNLPLPGQVHRAPALADGTLYAATRNGRLVAVRDRAIVWDRPLRRMPTTAVVHANGKLLVGTMEGLILVHDAKTGRRLTTLKPRYPSSFLADLTVHRGLVLGGTEDGRVHAFDLESGKVKWSFATRDVVRSSVTASGDRVYVGSTDGIVYVLDLDGNALMRFDLGSAVSCSPAFLDGFLYAAGRRNTLSAFDASGAGAPWWTFDLEREYALRITAGTDRIFVVTNKARIYAFEVDRR